MSHLTHVPTKRRRRPRALKGPRENPVRVVKSTSPPPHSQVFGTLHTRPEPIGASATSSAPGNEGGLWECRICDRTMRDILKGAHIEGHMHRHNQSLQVQSVEGREGNTRNDGALKQGREDGRGTLEVEGRQVQGLGKQNQEHRLEALQKEEEEERRGREELEKREEPQRLEEHARQEKQRREEELRKEEMWKEKEKLKKGGELQEQDVRGWKDELPQIIYPAHTERPKAPESLSWPSGPEFPHSAQKQQHTNSLPIAGNPPRTNDGYTGGAIGQMINPLTNHDIIPTTTNDSKNEQRALPKGIWLCETCKRRMTITSRNSHLVGRGHKAKQLRLDSMNQKKEEIEKEEIEKEVIEKETQRVAEINRVEKEGGREKGRLDEEEERYRQEEMRKEEQHIAIGVGKRTFKEWIAEQKQIVLEKRIGKQKRLPEETWLVGEERLEEARRIALDRRIAEQKRIAEARIEERKRIAEEGRLEEGKRVAEERRIALERQIAEQKRIAGKKRIAEEKRLEKEKRIAEQRRIAEERCIAEEKTLEEEKRIAEERRTVERIVEENRRAGDRRIMEELRRIAEEEDIGKLGEKHLRGQSYNPDKQKQYQYIGAAENQCTIPDHAGSSDSGDEYPQHKLRRPSLSTIDQQKLRRAGSVAGSTRGPTTETMQLKEEGPCRIGTIVVQSPLMSSPGTKGDLHGGGQSQGGTLEDPMSQVEQGGVVLSPPKVLQASKPSNDVQRQHPTNRSEEKGFRAKMFQYLLSQGELQQQPVEENTVKVWTAEEMYREHIMGQHMVQEQPLFVQSPASLLPAPVSCVTDLPPILYRVYDHTSVSVYTSVGFTAGNPYMPIRPPQFKAMVKRHANWSSRSGTPFISVTTSPDAAGWHVAKKRAEGQDGNVMVALIDTAALLGICGARIWKMHDAMDHFGLEPYKCQRRAYDNEYICALQIPARAIFACCQPDYFMDIALVFLKSLDLKG